MYIILAWIVIALVAGFIADYVWGRKKHYERWELFVVGMIGSFVGGAIFSFIEGGDLLTLRISGLLGSIIGAIIALPVYGFVRDRFFAPTVPVGKNTAMKSTKKK
jgi:uncharacterized membrane protein YeaQ/YmgE (transglycosylase-associated protein family)